MIRVFIFLVSLLSFGTVTLATSTPVYSTIQSAESKTFNEYLISKGYDTEYTQVSPTNLVTNGGNPFSSTTDWVSESGDLTISSNYLLYTSTSIQTYPAVRPSTDIFLADNVSYTITKISVNLATQATITLRSSVAPYTVISTQTTPTNNTFYILKGSFLPTSNCRPRIDVPLVSGDTISIAYMMSFNLTDLYGVTDTSGSAYDSAVAAIDEYVENGITDLNEDYFTILPFDETDLQFQSDYADFFGSYTDFTLNDLDEVRYIDYNIEYNDDFSLTDVVLILLGLWVWLLLGKGVKALL